MNLSLSNDYLDENAALFYTKVLFLLSFVSKSQHSSFLYPAEWEQQSFTFVSTQIYSRLLFFMSE